jgi:mannose-1-phosphate guanylyltransferase
LSFSNDSHVYGILLAGGRGTRLWPLSTTKHAKQFLKIGSSRSLIQQTFARVAKLIASENIGVVCGQEHNAELIDQLPLLTKNRIWLEPQPRNTLPAITLAAFQLAREDPQAIMVVTPADHFIPTEDEANFGEDLALAIQLAEKKSQLITLGIRPTVPATGFGYMEVGERKEQAGRPYFSIRRFHEKPELATAQAYLRDGSFFWNSGIFVWKVQTFLEELRRFQLQVFSEFSKLGTDQNLRHTLYSHIPSLSVDYGLMEKSQNVAMIPASFAWDDVGHLIAFEKVLFQDALGNHFEKEVYVRDAKNNLVLGNGKPVALLGVQDLIVVDTPEALLILPKSRVQDVKNIVEDIKNSGRVDLV